MNFGQKLGHFDDTRLYLCHVFRQFFYLFVKRGTELHPYNPKYCPFRKYEYSMNKSNITLFPESVNTCFTAFRLGRFPAPGAQRRTAQKYEFQHIS